MPPVLAALPSTLGKRQGSTQSTTSHSGGHCYSAPSAMGCPVQAQAKSLGGGLWLGPGPSANQSALDQGRSTKRRSRDAGLSGSGKCDGGDYGCATRDDRDCERDGEVVAGSRHDETGAKRQVVVSPTFIAEQPECRAGQDQSDRNGDANDVGSRRQELQRPKSCYLHRECRADVCQERPLVGQEEPAVRVMKVRHGTHVSHHGSMTLESCHHQNAVLPPSGGWVLRQASRPPCRRRRRTHRPPRKRAGRGSWRGRRSSRR